jgi:hypothetical protein
MDYDRYIDCLNRGDDDAFADQWLTQDCTFQFPTRGASGREAIKKFLAVAHDGIREILRPQIVIRDGDLLAAEVDIDFHALRDLPGHPFGALKQGSVTTVKFFLHYRIEGDRVAELKASRWPPEQGVTKG